MLHKLHRKLGTAGFVISIVALVAALGGGAYAASNALNGKQKKEVEKIAKKYAGKPGAAGAAGATGPAGAPGAKGDAGAAGTNGTNGTNGSNGKSVVIGNATTCPSGGKTVEVEGSGVKSNVCNGQTGFTETLPAGMTETGAWVVGITPLGTTLYVRTPISFPIPLSADLAAANVHYVNVGETAPAGCTGGTAAAPTADPGHLCVYETFESFLVFEAILKPTSDSEAPGAGATGALLRFDGEEEAQAWGTWAVTAEAE
ncbi:MAG TPA: hypothetical protein VIT89_01785 [Solirubrobacterales bacterium]